MSEEVRSMFGKIARRYDLANDLLSFGIHRTWRRSLVKYGQVNTGQNVLDLCSGTGELSLFLAEAVGSTGSVVGVDFSEEMHTVALNKLNNQRLRGHALSNLTFEVGDALHLRFPDRQFDVVTVAFGIRNVDSLDAFFEEAARVLRPGGKLLVLEFGSPHLPVFSSFYVAYSKYIMPLVGGWITGNRSAYEYLPQTAAAFPCRDKFCDLMAKRFCLVDYRSLSGGIAYIYSGVTAGGN